MNAGIPRELVSLSVALLALLTPATPPDVTRRRRRRDEVAAVLRDAPATIGVAVGRGSAAASARRD